MVAGERKHILGIDIGGTNFRLGMVAEDGRIYNFVLQSSHILHDNKSNPLSNLAKFIQEYVKANSAFSLPLAVSIGFPSAISKDKKIVYSSPNMKDFNNVNVVDTLEDVLKIPLFIDNDVNNLLMYEIIKRNLEGKGVSLGFYVGTGFGNAIYMNNHILEGKNGVAAELGHMPVFGKQDRCACGNNGCIELYASGKRLEEINRKTFSETSIKKMFVEHRNEPVIQEFIETVSLPIATEITILDPDYVFIGGGVINMEGFPKRDLEKYIYNHTRKPYPANKLNLFYAENSQEIGVVGASMYAFKKISQKGIPYDCNRK